jgi:hypothetical protein
MGAHLLDIKTTSAPAQNCIRTTAGGLIKLLILLMVHIPTPLRVYVPYPPSFPIIRGMTSTYVCARSTHATAVPPGLWAIHID